MFLNEVALGKEHHITRDDHTLTSPPKGFDCVIAKGQTEPGMKLYYAYVGCCVLKLMLCCIASHVIVMKLLSYFHRPQGRRNHYTRREGSPSASGQTDIHTTVFV